MAAPPGTRYFRRFLTLDKDSRIASARLAMTVDNEFVCWVNGRRVGSGDNFTQAYVMNVTSALVPGQNAIAVAATNTTSTPNPAGFIGLLTIKFQNGRTLQVPTDQSWEVAEKAGEGWQTKTVAASPWAKSMELGPLGMAPWGNIEGSPNMPEVFPDATVIHDWLLRQRILPDFDSEGRHPLRYIHRRIGETDVYFVANGSTESFATDCFFRGTGRQPELWHPESGRIAPLAAYYWCSGRTCIPLQFGPMESFFIVFRNPDNGKHGFISITREGQNLLAPGYVPMAEGTLDLIRSEIGRPGTYVFKTVDGREREFTCKGLPAPVKIDGPWDVSFDPKWGGPMKVSFTKLEDWSKRPEEGIKYYSGTARYRTTFTLPADALQQPPTCWNLDLGKVAVMAEVKLNGKDLGILWKAPYRVDVSKALKPGENVLELKVVNLWINRQIGDEHLPEDSKRNPDGTLKEWPKWLVEGQPSPTGRYTFTSWRLWKKNDPLQESGLMGPVILHSAVRFNLP